MKIRPILLPAIFLAVLPLAPAADVSQSLAVGPDKATMSLREDGDLRAYQLSTTATLRDDREKTLAIDEIAGRPSIRTGSVMFDGLYAMAVKEAELNSVTQISDDSYDKGTPVVLDAYETGELWKYVWTRDLAYALRLSLAGFDPKRAVNSLLFKASTLKSAVSGGFDHQIIQDTGSGGSYPVSTDRVVWAIGASETLKYLSGAERQAFVERIYPMLCGTIEQDRKLVFDPKDGLYRGEHSFLDWRQQTYPIWTTDSVLPIAMSKALSVNAANYFLLRMTAELARERGDSELGAKYAKWAEDLKKEINDRLYDAKAGLYRTYLLSEDGSYDMPVARYDLLGESLAILFDIASPAQADAILRSYPTGPSGPPVIWPQERDVPIYHNQGIWPFVTAFWVKAAQKAGNAAAVDAGLQSLMQLSAINLSNMENYDFVTGSAHVKEGPRQGPVVNSRRQLWSVAGYLSMVQDTVFGLDVSEDGIRFAPFVTARLRNDTLRSANAIELRDLPYLGTKNLVRVQLPPAGSFADGVCAIAKVVLNGKPIGAGFVPAKDLKPENTWEITLEAPATPRKSPPLRVASVRDDRAIFGPVQPQWKGEGVTMQGGRAQLEYSHPDAAQVAFDIYRDGRLCARGVRQTKWIDMSTNDAKTAVHAYAVKAVDTRSGNTSHPTPSRSARSASQQQIVPASSMENRGGDLVGGSHFENWGQRDDELIARDFKVAQSGRYSMRVEFANGAGPVSTGVTCAVKKLEVRDAAGKPVASGYVIMPQSGDWKRWDLSSAVAADLDADTAYTLRVFEDEYSRNMSYLKNNDRYTANNGGGPNGYNYVNIASIHLLYASPQTGAASVTSAAAAGQ